jgi:chorismate mutase
MIAPARQTTFLTASLLALLPACARQAPPVAGPSTDPTAAVDHLLDLMRQRLLVMHDVARWKWNHGKRIADPPREQAFLDGMAEKGRQLNIDPEWTRAFFAAQIEAAKQIQQADFDRWTAEKREPFADALDLKNVLRPRIDELSRSLLDALAQVQARIGDDQIQYLLQQRAALILIGDGIDAGVRATALKPLLPRSGPRPREWSD